MTIQHPQQQIIAGRYEVLGPLGTGAQGDAYRVLDHHQREIVALKLLSGSVNLGPWHEAAALTRLRDTHVLPIRNADLAAGVPFLVTALAEHGTVADRIVLNNHAGVAPTTAIRWARQLCQAIARTHDGGLLHTDVKPANLFVDERDDVLLGDYGLASVMDSFGMGHTSGSSETLAPEVALAIVNQTALGTSVRSDVYSIGATLYWMLSGQPPFAPAPGQDLLRSAPDIAVHTPTPLLVVAPHIENDLARRVAVAMSRDPANRFGTAGDFASALGSLTSPGRVWTRTNEHSTHVGCWRSEAKRGSAILVCAESAGTKVQIQAVRLPSGRRVSGTNALVTRATASRAVRRVISRCT